MGENALMMANTANTAGDFIDYCRPWYEPVYCYPTPIVNTWLVSPPKTIRDFSDEELVSELKRRKRDRNALDQITIKED